MKKIKILSLITVFLFTFLFSAVSEAKTFYDLGPWEKTGLISASILASIPYSPLKLTYAFLGGITSGMVLAFTAGQATESASRIAKQASTGDWYVPPDVFLGSEYLDFVGPDDR